MEERNSAQGTWQEGMPTTCGTGTCPVAQASSRCPLTAGLHSGSTNPSAWRHGLAARATALVLVLLCFLSSGCNDLHSAAREGDAAALERALERGVDPDRRNFSNATLLHEAAAAGHLDVVMLLVKHGADVNRQGDTYQTPLHVAVQAGHTDVALYLLDHDAEISKTLHETAYHGHVHIARLLLEHGADINEKAQDEVTPLEAAAAHGQLDLVAILLANGADVNAQGIYGRTALHVAASKDDLEIARLLLEHGADPALESNGRSVAGRSDAFRSLLTDHQTMR